MRGRCWGTLLVLLVSVSVPARGQTPSGEISGTAVDTSGLAVPGVTITLVNQATNVVRTVQTNESGLYVITAIPPGTYDLKAELSGFGTVERKNLVVQVGSAIRIALTLQVGALSETVLVTAGSPLIQTENAAISTVIENRAIVELPLNGRNYLQLASLIPCSRPSTRWRNSTSSPASSTRSTAAPSLKSTSRPNPDRTSFAARGSSSRAIPRSTPRTISTGRICPSRRSSETSTGSRSAAPWFCRRSWTAETACSSCSTGRGCARTSR